MQTRRQRQQMQTRRQTQQMQTRRDRDSRCRQEDRHSRCRQEETETADADKTDTADKKTETSDADKKKTDRRCRQDDRRQQTQTRRQTADADKNRERDSRCRHEDRASSAHGPEEPVSPEEVDGGVELVAGQEVGHGLVVLALLFKLLRILLTHRHPRLVRGCHDNNGEFNVLHESTEGFR